MPNSSFIFTKDWHFSSKPPKRRKANYGEEILDMVGQLRKYCVEHGPRAMFHAGDFFHLHTGGYIPWKDGNRLIDILEGWPCPIYAILGNHDFPAGPQETFVNRPAGALVASKVIALLGTEPTFLDDYALYGINYGIKERGGEWPEINFDKNKFNILLTHETIDLGNMNMPDFVDHFEVKDVPPADLTYNGHIHVPQNDWIVRDEIGERRICSPPSLGRVNVREDFVPSFMLADIDPKRKISNIEHIQLSADMDPFIDLDVPSVNEFNTEKLVEAAEAFSKASGEGGKVLSVPEALEMLLTTSEVSSEVKSMCRKLLLGQEIWT